MSKTMCAKYQIITGTIPVRRHRSMVWQRGLGFKTQQLHKGTPVITCTFKMLQLKGGRQIQRRDVPSQVEYTRDKKEA